jgi:nitronate monooxygenase
MQAGGMGACGALLMDPVQIQEWAADVRRSATGPFQINLWIPDSPPLRDPSNEERIRAFLGKWGPPVPVEAGDRTPPDFETQCQAMLDIKPVAISSIMGLFPASFVERMKDRGIAWFATVTTVTEAWLAAEAGADVIVAQGMEAGGHRGCFDPRVAEERQVGLLALLPQVVDAVKVPVVAAGGIADARGIAAALLLGASAVAIGTGFLRCPEAGIPDRWASALAASKPEDTMLTRAFSGRAGRSLATEYVRAAASADAPRPAPYPVQRGLTAAMRQDAQQRNDLKGLQAWAGQGAALARALPAAALWSQLWAQACDLLANARIRRAFPGQP